MKCVFSGDARLPSRAVFRGYGREGKDNDGDGNKGGSVTDGSGVAMS